MSVDILHAQRSQKESELATSQVQLSIVEDKLTQVRQAKREIAELKKTARATKNKWNELNYVNRYYWYGARQSDFESGHHEKVLVQATKYYRRLDRIADQLVDVERMLKDEKQQYGIIIEQLHNAISWFWGEIEKAVN
ncbi:MAG: hypothetical protein ACK5ML_11965 [Lachnospiraceae bacterium]